MKTYILFLIAVVFLVACGKEREHTVTTIEKPPVVIEVPVPVPPPVPTEVELLVAEKNQYRLVAGQLPLTIGLTCTLHETNNSDLTVALPSAKYTFGMFKAFNQPDSNVSERLNILPAALQAIYTNNYAVRCQGQLVITEPGYYSFELSSDDGSILYLDGALLVNNNGNHGCNTVVGSKLLDRGVHTFRLDYAQTGAGSQCLMLKSNNTLIPAERFYR